MTVPGGPDDTTFWSEAVYGALSGQALVKLSFAGRSTTVDTESARRIAKDIIDTAHAADSDAFVVDAFVFEFFRDEIGLPPHEAVAMLGKFRDWRIRRGERWLEVAADLLFEIYEEFSAETPDPKPA